MYAILIVHVCSLCFKPLSHVNLLVTSFDVLSFTYGEVMCLFIGVLRHGSTIFSVDLYCLIVLFCSGPFKGFVLISGFAR